MDISVVEAYAKGRMAGINHSAALLRNPGANPPASPYSGSAYLAGVEWERGFTDGFAQGERSRAANKRGIERRSA